VKIKSMIVNLTQTIRKLNPTCLAVAISLGLAINCSPTLAQSGAGSIQGTITDPTGAVLPGAGVHVVNLATSGATDTQSNSVGFYQVPALFTGSYSVTVTAPGMKTYQTTLELLVDQHAVINPVMTTGAVTEQVQVAADAVQLTTTENGTISSTLENTRINQLPMNGRVLTSLVGMTAPGVEGGQRSNGLMAEALEYVADGVPLSNRQFGGMNQSSAQTPDPDAVQEVRVETTNTGAMYTEPGTVIITTKSGTNQLHGSFFETARNNAVGIAKSRSNASNFAAPHLVRNEFGASAGGPIILPHVYHGKDKSFWFFAYERYSLASFTAELATVPTQAMKQGDFSQLINSSGQLQQLYDPATTAFSSNCNGSGTANNWCRAPFANNQIPIGRLSPTAKILDDIIPNPTNTNNPLVTTNLSTNGINNSRIPTETFRFDHEFNTNNRAYLRYSDNFQKSYSLRNNPANGPATIAADGIPANASGVTYTPTSTYAAAIGFTHVFSPTFFSETIVSQQWFAQHNSAAGSPSTNFEKILGTPNNFGESGFPQIASGDTMLQSALQGTMYAYGLSQIVTSFDENLTKTVGRHQMQFGGRYRHERFGDQPDQNYDSITFGAYASALVNPSSGTNYTATPSTGFYQGDFFLGAPSSYTVQLQPPYMHFHDMEFDGYFQDNFHATKNLTVNIGLRYEAHPAAWAKDGMMATFDLNTRNIVMPNPISSYISAGYTTQAIVSNLQNLGLGFETPSQANMPANTLMRNYNFTFGPRVGFAYQLFGGNHGTVVRGAYGRYIYPMPVRSTLNNIARDVPFVAGYSQSYVAANQLSGDGQANYLMRAPQTSAGPLSAGTPIMGVNSTSVIDTTSTTAIQPGISPYYMNPIQPPDYVTQTNFTIEQALKGNSALRITWLWTHGTNLDQEFEPNTHPSTYVWEMNTGTALPTGTLASVATGPWDQKVWSSSAVLDQKSGWSNDNALQATYQRLFHHGVAYQINYVWSKPFRVGGNYFRDGYFQPASDYVNASGTLGTMTSAYPATAPALPPSAPSGTPSWASYHALNVFENYKVDTAIPKQHIMFNGVVDLPFGRGKRYLGTVNRFVDELIGGFQLAGSGSIVSQDFFVGSGNWGPTNPLHTYKHKAPITDCRSGTCYKAYEWFNGYIAPGVVNASVKGVSGLPSGWASYASPIDTNYNPVTPGGTAQDTNYNTNNVNVTLANGTIVKGVGFSPGPYGNNPYSKTCLNGPINYSADLSLFKVLPITGRVNLRVNVDAFNAFNIQGNGNPDTTAGVQQVVPGSGASSYWTPRQLQFTMRLTF